nr:hypothetical protein [Candidatus Sigynarchaeota archaeon]
MALKRDTIDITIRSGTLIACVSIIVAQSLTIQRSLSSMTTLDWIGMAIFGIALPITGSIVLARWPATRFVVSARPWLLATCALLQAIIVVFWPAYIMPGALVFMIGGNLVILSGGTLQFAIIGFALVLAVHTVVVTTPSYRPGMETRQSMIGIGVGGGLLVAGLSMGLAAYNGWTMYLLPSLLIMLLFGSVDLIFGFRDRDGHVASKSPSVVNQQATSESSDPMPRSSKLGNVVSWAATIFVALPFLLLAMNFQRPRYAIGFFLPLVTVGAAAIVVGIAWNGIAFIRKRQGNGHLSDSATTAVMLGSLIVAGCLDIVPLIAIASLQPEIAATFFKSMMYMEIITGAFVAGFMALIPALAQYSTTLEKDGLQGKKNANILLGGVVLALIVVVLLFEGTSMIFSWNFGESETIIVTAAMEGLGWFFVAAACILLGGIIEKHQKNTQKHKNFDK